MDNAAAVVVTKLTAYVPLPDDLATQLKTAELWFFYLPLLYVTMLPLISLLIMIVRESVKAAGRRRGRRILKKLGNVALVTSPSRKYVDLEGGKTKKAAPKGKKGLSA